MRPIAVITDSVANLPRHLAEALQVRVVPLLVIFRDAVFRDGIDMSAKEFFRRLREGEVATTSQPVPEQFRQAYEAAGAAPGILVITISSRLSGTFESACQAARQFGRLPIRVIDSLTASFGEGWMVVEAARAALAGEGLDAIVARVRALRQRVGVLAIMETLEYVRRTGRIGRAAALVGGMLKVRPIVTVAADGVVEALSRPRTTLRAIEEILDRVAADRQPGTQLHVAVLHGGNEDSAHSLLEDVRRRFPCRESLMEYMTPVIGAHAGPGVLGVAYHWS